MLNLMNASKAEIAAADAAYRIGVVDGQNRVRTHLRDTGGPEADGKLASLAGIGSWFLQHIQDVDDRSVLDGVPAWWDPTSPLAGSGVEGDGPFTGQQLRLIDEVQAYVAEVLLNEIPGAEWTIYQGGKREMRNGKTVLKLRGRLQAYPQTIVYSAALQLVLLEKAVSDRWLFDCVADRMAKAKVA